MPRTLILGGAGFIGYHMAVRLAGEGHELTLVDDLSRGRLDRELEALCTRPNVTLVQADLTRPDALAELPREWDGVHMLAAVVGVRNVETDPARVVRTNTLAGPGAEAAIVRIKETGSSVAISLDGNGRREPVDMIERRLLHLPDELPRVGAQALDVAALPLGIDRIEGERRLARARQAGDHHQRVARHIHVDILQIVLARAAHADVLMHEAQVLTARMS